MQAISNYFNDLVTDVNAAVGDQIPDQEIQAKRLGSIYSRVLGGFCIAAGVMESAQHLARAINLRTSESPRPTAVSRRNPGAFMMTAVCFGVIGHDAIRLGYNLRKAFAGIDAIANPNNSIVKKGMGIITTGKDVASVAAKTVWHSTPYYLHDTLLLEPLYRLLKLRESDER